MYNQARMWKNLPLRGYIYASFSIDLVLVIIVLALRNFLPPVVPLFYGLPSGENQLVPQLGLLIVPGVSLLITILNTSIASSSKDEFFKTTLIVSSALISVLAAVAVLKIIFLVGYF